MSDKQNSSVPIGEDRGQTKHGGQTKPAQAPAPQPTPRPAPPSGSGGKG